MRAFNLLPVVAIALLVGYSVIATTTSGAATAVASPMLVAAIAVMVWHDRVADNA